MTTSASDPGADLESQIRKRRGEIVAALDGLRDDTRREAAGERDQLKAKLAELTRLIKDNVVDGWANLGATARFQLGYWLGSK
jgi:uncharacterized protein YjbJ (UPF0337 family)